MSDRIFHQLPQDNEDEFVRLFIILKYSGCQRATVLIVLSNCFIWSHFESSLLSGSLITVKCDIFFWGMYSLNSMIWLSICKKCKKLLLTINNLSTLSFRKWSRIASVTTNGFVKWISWWGYRYLPWLSTLISWWHDWAISRRYYPVRSKLV